MEVYLNIAETGIGIFGSERRNKAVFRAMTRRASTPTDMGRIAALQPLTKKRAAIDPHGFVRSHGNTLARRVGTVREDGLDGYLG